MNKMSPVVSSQFDESARMGKDVLVAPTTAVIEGSQHRKDETDERKELIKQPDMTYEELDFERAEELSKIIQEDSQFVQDGDL
jgi:formylmethanofuran:tetrahydromethanopterin formyltransferase